MNWVGKMAHWEHITFLIGLGIGLFMVVLGSYTHGSETMQEQMQQEAVEAGKAHWCIVDHEKVFSWKECSIRLNTKKN